MLFTLIRISFGTGFSQCISLGCAGNYGTKTADGTLPNLSGTLLGEEVAMAAEPLINKYFGNFSIRPRGAILLKHIHLLLTEEGQLDLDYIVYDMGVSAPASIPCPIDPTSWTMVICNNFGGFDLPTGPGVAGSGGDVFTTTSGHYYAIAVILWQGISNGGDASYASILVLRS